MAGITATLADLDGPSSVGTSRAERYDVTNGQPVVTAGVGAGTLAAGTLLGGYDSVFTFRVTSGSSAAAPGTIATVVLANVLASTPNPAVLPVNAASQLLTEAQDVRASVRGLGTIDIITPGTLTAATAYDFEVTMPDAVVTLAQGAAWLAVVDSVSTTMPLLTVSKSGGTATLGVRPAFGSAQLTLTGKG